MNLGGDDSYDDYNPKTDMSEVLRALGVDGTHNISSGMSEEVFQAYPHSTIASLKEDLKIAQQEAKLNFDALHELMRICKSRGFDPFEGESLPLKIKPCDMTREQLLERNKEATARVVKTRHVTTSGQIPMPTLEEECQLYPEDPQITQLVELIEETKNPKPLEKPTWGERFRNIFSRDED